MKNKKGFAFVETIITVVILSASLLYLYSTYNAILSDEKVRVYYDDPSFIYYTNYVKKFFEEYADLENIKRSKFNDTYVISIGTGYQDLLKDRSMAAALEKIVESFRINHIAIVKSDMFNNCFEGTEEYCESSIKNLNYNMQKYVTSLSDTKYNYYLVVEYAIRLDETTGKQVKCTPTIDKRCQTYYASIGLSGDKYETLANYVISQYGSAQGNNDIYYHNASLTNGANDNSYRYAGASESVNNFVCFGSTTSPCPTDNLYRIIGVFEGQVKLIKYDYANSNLLGTDGDYNTSTYSKSEYSSYKGNLTTINTYTWNNSTNKNTWSESLLNKTNLNANFVTNIGEKWVQKIATTTWKVGGNTFVNIMNVIPATEYQNEVVNPVTMNTTDNKTEYTAKIGLMYISDYGFAAEPSAWTLNMNRYDNTTATSTNWMYMGLSEWTLSRLADTSEDGDAFGVLGTGDVHNTLVYGGYFGVRPSFNLESSTTYVSGEGTQNSPIIIN